MLTTPTLYDPIIEATTSKAERQGFDADGAADFIHKLLLSLGDEGATGEFCVNQAIAAGFNPENPKAFGGVFVRLRNAKRIVKGGYAPREKGHGSVGIVWRAKR